MENKQIETIQPLKNPNNNPNNNYPLLLTDIQIQSFDNMLFKNEKNEKVEKHKVEIFRRWRTNYLRNSGRLYIQIGKNKQVKIDR